MRYCADSWLFVELSRQNQKAQEILRRVRKGEDYLVVPSVVLLEVTREAARIGKPHLATDLLTLMKMVKNIKVVDATAEICSMAGKLSASYNIPAIDAIIAATAIEEKCGAVLTDDIHFDILSKHKLLKKSALK
ncbi:MAG: type II toxin-antitoxin system VapC family toxin [Candidatus Thermoplasmatota archaeon]|nr:type II toxin-antitoxin system VapC family toxin [Candidatus Thermoplasmatota archaeon]